MAEEEQQRRGGISPADLVRRGLQAKNAIGGFGALFSNPLGAAVLIAVGALIVLSLVVLLITPGAAAPLEISKGPTSPGIGGTTSLNSCQFFRSNEGASFKSQKLLDYFQEASLKSGVPAALLAAIARIEFPEIVNYTDNNFSSFSCPESDTGALGLMQIEPSKMIRDQSSKAKDIEETIQKNGGTDPYFREGVNLGASFLGLTAEQLTRGDFCDPRENIFLAAGFILKKLQYPPYKIGDGTKWDASWTAKPDIINNVAEGYYGCLKYDPKIKNYNDACKTGQYSYGDDLWNSLDNCRSNIFASTPAPPASSDYQTLHDQILKEFKVDFEPNNEGKSFHYDYLKWAWEKLWQIKSTRFLELVRGQGDKIITIKRDDSDTSKQTGCPIITMRGYRPDGSHYAETLFKVALIHELSHIIQACNPGNSRFNELESVVKEGYLTAYSQHSLSCAGTDNTREDYAETLSYFLNPDLPEQSYFSFSLNCPPPSNLTAKPLTNKPLHNKFAQKLLIVPSLLAMDSASCPVENGKIYIPSFQANPTTGHCGQDYLAKAGNQQGLLCSGDSRQGKSIDVYTEGSSGKGPNGKDVVLPLINGQTLQWKLLRIDSLGDDLCFSDELLGYGCGNRLVFQADLEDGKNWTLHLTHLYLPSIKLEMGKTYPSGTIAGKSAPIHTHISVGKNIQDVMSVDESGWLSPDSQLKMCTSGV